MIVPWVETVKRSHSMGYVLGSFIVGEDAATPWVVANIARLTFVRVSDGEPHNKGLSETLLALGKGSASRAAIIKATGLSANTVGAVLRRLTSGPSPLVLREQNRYSLDAAAAKARWGQSDVRLRYGELTKQATPLVRLLAAYAGNLNDDHKTAWCAPRLGKALGWAKAKTERLMRAAKRAGLLVRWRDASGMTWTSARTADLSKRALPVTDQSTAPMMLKNSRGECSKTVWADAQKQWGSMLKNSTPSDQEKERVPRGSRDRPKPDDPDQHTFEQQQQKTLSSFGLEGQAKAADRRNRTRDGFAESLRLAARWIQDQAETESQWLVVLIALGIRPRTTAARWSQNYAALRQMSAAMVQRGESASMAVEWCLLESEAGLAPLSIAKSLCATLTEKTTKAKASVAQPMMASTAQLVAPAKRDLVYANLLTNEQQEKLAQHQKLMTAVAKPMDARDSSPAAKERAELREHFLAILEVTTEPDHRERLLLKIETLTLRTG